MELEHEVQFKDMLKPKPKPGKIGNSKPITTQATLTSINNPPSYELFAPQGFAKEQRKIKTNNELLNNSKFNSYWYMRNKNKPVNESEIKYGQFNDIDGDKIPDSIAIQDNRVLGHNQYYITPKNTADQQHLYDYYIKAPNDRKTTYSEYLYEKINENDKRKINYNKKLSTKIKPILDSISHLYQSLKPAIKVKVANIITAIIKDSMIDSETTKDMRNAIKKLPLFKKYQKEYIEKILDENVIKISGKDLVKYICEDRPDLVVKFFEKLATSWNYYLTADDVEEVYGEY